MNEKVILWDKDSTLADTSHRHHMLGAARAGTIQWAEYDRKCLDDKPLEGSVALMRLLDPYYRQIVVSGAHQSAEPEIRKWARIHGIPITEMILRSDGDRRPNGVFKAAVVRKMQESGLDVVLFIDDFTKAAAKIRETSVPVLVVNPEYEEVPERDSSSL